MTGSGTQFTFTDEDRMNPVYCIGCRRHIPRQVSNVGRGLCPDCMARIAGTQASQPPPPPQSGPPLSSQPTQAYPPSSLGVWQRPIPNFDKTLERVGLGVVAFALLVAFVAALVNGNRPEPQSGRPNGSRGVAEDPAARWERELQARRDVQAADEAAQRRKVNSEFPDRWAFISGALATSGARVQPWSNREPRTMRIQLSVRESLETSPHQAREMAGIVRDRLHPDATVIIETAGGQTLATATPHGFR